jgi:hypothetical protein
MEKTMELTAETVHEMRNELQRAIAEVGKKYNFDFKLGRILYTDVSFKTELKGLAISASGGVTADPNHENKARYAFHIAQLGGVSIDGYNNKIIGETIALRGESGLGKILDFNPRAKRYPLVVQYGNKMYNVAIRSIEKFVS